MRGADIFLMYADGNGNVTLSTRSGVNHAMPKSSPRRDVTLLAGSGIIDGQMIANVRCHHCPGLDAKGSSDWISAWKQGEPIGSSHADASIDYPDDHAVFQVDFAKAKIATDANPFDVSGGERQGPPPGNPSRPGAGVTTAPADKNANLILAHGIIMTVVFPAMYPLGAVLMPIFGKWSVHAGWQTVAFCAMWAGLAIGYIVAADIGIVSRPRILQTGSCRLIPDVV